MSCLGNRLGGKQPHWGEGDGTPLQYSCLENPMEGGRSLVGCSPWGREESDTTERLHFDFSLSCIGEGNGNPLQCSCLENPRDGGAWWAAVYGVAQSRTRLKRLSSSSSSSIRTGAWCGGPWCLHRIGLERSEMWFWQHGRKLCSLELAQCFCEPPNIF